MHFNQQTGYLLKHLKSALNSTPGRYVVDSEQLTKNPWHLVARNANRLCAFSNALLHACLEHC